MQLSSVQAIATVLNQANIRYLAVGGLAINAHGYQRFTNDLDLVIQLTPSNIQSALEALSSIGYLPRIPVTPAQFASAENRQRWREEKGMLVLNLHSDQHRRTPLDVFVSEPFDFDSEYLKATSYLIDETTSIPVVSLPTLLQMKRDAARPKDLLDIDAISKIQNFLDRQP